MRRFLTVAGIILALAFPTYAIQLGRTGSARSSASSEPKVYVKGHYRKDGTYVPPHYRSAPGSGHTTSAKTSSGSSSTSGHPRGCKTCPRDEHGRIKRSPAARKEFLRQTGYPHGRPGYVVDHIVPLECGGADDPSNMQWQTVAEAKAKDKTERNCRR